jgi:hypothetical protein
MGWDTPLVVLYVEKFMCVCIGGVVRCAGDENDKQDYAIGPGTPSGGEISSPLVTGHVDIYPLSNSIHPQHAKKV